jgi:hypothetical protein
MEHSPKRLSIALPLAGVAVNRASLEFEKKCG